MIHPEDNRSIDDARIDGAPRERAIERLQFLADACDVPGLDHLPVVARENASGFAADIRAAFHDLEALRSALLRAELKASVMLTALEEIAHLTSNNWSSSEWLMSNPPKHIAAYRAWEIASSAIASVEKP